METLKEEYTISTRKNQCIIVIKHGLKNPRGTAVIHHGYPGAVKSPTVQLIRKTFNKLGFDTVTPDTTHNYNKSEGDYRLHTMTQHCDDLMDCITYTMAKGSFQGPLIVAGHSAGGYSALSVSAKLAQASITPALTVASAPLISGQRYMSAWKAVIKNAGIDPDRFMKNWENAGAIKCGSDAGPDELDLMWSVMQEWCKHNLISANIVPSNPTVLISGEKDEFITHADVTAYFEHSKIKEFISIEDANHSYTRQEQAFVSALKNAITSNFPAP